MGSLDGLESCSLGLVSCSDDLDHLNVRAEDQNASKAGWGTTVVRQAGVMMLDCQQRRDPGLACSRMVRRHGSLLVGLRLKETIVRFGVRVDRCFPHFSARGVYNKTLTSISVLSSGCNLVSADRTARR